MRKDFGMRTWLFPEPVLIIATYNEDGSVNAMNAAWGGMYDDDKISLCLSKDHKTTENIKKRKAFTVAFATESTMIPCDYVGIVSGNDVPDKFSKAGFTASKSSFVDAPLINELPMAVECELCSAEGEQIVGKIVNVSADESVLGENGKPDWRKLRPLIYDPVNFGYIGFGEEKGRAFSEGKKLK